MDPRLIGFGAVIFVVLVIAVSSSFTIQTAIEGVQASDVTALVLVTQYLDTMKEIGASANSNTTLLPHSRGAISDLMSHIRNAFSPATSQPTPSLQRRATALPYLDRRDWRVLASRFRCRDVRGAATTPPDSL